MHDTHGDAREPHPTDEAETDTQSIANRTIDGGKVMEFADTVRIRTTKDDLWAVISDPEMLTECVPGAESIERRSERIYSLEITRGVSHLTISLSGEAEFVELNEPDWMVVNGFAHDTKTGSDFGVLAAMEMTAPDDETVELSYTAEVTFTGGVASLGPRLLKPIVRRDVDKYFENVRDTVEVDGR